jgi:hypothetical protein
MKITFPESLDSLNLRPDRQARNAAESSHAVRFEDILYMIAELEKKVGANNSTDQASLECRVAALEASSLVQTARTSLLQSAIAAVQSLIKAFSVRSNKTEVTVTGTYVQLSTPMTSTYVILGSCYNSSGELTGYVVSDQSSSGFTITPDQDGTFEWIAVQIN